MGFYTNDSGVMAAEIAELKERVRDLEKNMGGLWGQPSNLYGTPRVELAEAIRLILQHLELELKVAPAEGPKARLEPVANWKAINVLTHPVPEKPKCSCGCVCRPTKE